MHSQLALTDHVSTNLAPLILLDPVLCRLPRQQQLSCICAPGQMEDLVCPSLSTHNTCTTSHKRTLHSRKSHRHRSSRLLVVSFMTTPTWRATLPISFILAFPPPRRECFDSTVRQVHNKSSWRDGAFRLPWYITYYKYGTE